MALLEQIHPRLAPMRRASRVGRLYTGPCPFCADGGDDRFHVWMEANGGRPAERYWCRVCNQRGLLRNLDDDKAPPVEHRAPRPLPQRHTERPEPNPAHIPHYQTLYTATALWAHSWMLDGCHPDPQRYLHRRGLSDATISRYLLGVSLNDPDSLVTYLRQECPESFPYAEEAGLLVRDDAGMLRTHWNLRGRIVFPYIAGSQVVDLRTRTYDGQKGYRSLGPYEPRGARTPFAWESVTPGTRTVIIAEAEFKALAALQAYHAGELAYPTIGQPGLTVFRATWADALRASGVETVVLCYDSQRRVAKDGVLTLAPEEQWSLRHGATCAAAGLEVRIARLPLSPSTDKAEIDTFVTSDGTVAFQQVIDRAPLLDEYHHSLNRALLERHQLPVPDAYPLRRPRPQRLSETASPASYPDEPPRDTPTLAQTRSTIAEQVEAHATSGQGLLVLAHPPGSGKGHNTTVGLKRWLHNVPSGEDGSGFLVWTALRKAQIDDQAGIPLIPLHGRGPQNCRKLPEAMTLGQKGYSVKDALCMRRCPHVSHCAYLRQFQQEGDFFAATALLKSTGWWKQAGVVVLDEFDPTSLIQQVQLTATDLAAMCRAHADKPAIQTLLRWIAQATATTIDRTLTGALWLDELVQHLIAQLARPDQPKIILDATASLDLLRAIFPATPIRMERPIIPGAMRITQVVGRDWSKSTLRVASKEGNGKRQIRWFDEVAGHIRPGRPTLVVCTQECEEALRAALLERGHHEVKVAHYGALRGSNAYLGHDVILAQVYHPNLEQVVREGRALFADDDVPLDERLLLADTRLEDATGATWCIAVPTFADPRLQALLAQRREAELLQCALRGRPFDHPDTQITLLFSLPVPGLPPTVIVQATQSSASNAGREEVVKAQLCAAAQQLLDQGVRVIDVRRLAAAAHVSVVTARKHWTHVAARLHLRVATRRQRAAMPRGGERFYERMVLLRRGRWAPPREECERALAHKAQGTASPEQDGGPAMVDHARNRSLVTRLIRRERPARRRRLAFHTVRPARPRPDRGPPPRDNPPRPPPDLVIANRRGELGRTEGGHSRGGTPGTKGKKRILPLLTPAATTPGAHWERRKNLNTGRRLKSSHRQIAHQRCAHFGVLRECPTPSGSSAGALRLPPL